MRLALTTTLALLPLAVWRSNPPLVGDEVPPTPVCSGCGASGESNGFGSGTAGTVSIHVTTTSGHCLLSGESCESSPCSVSIDRTWSGVASGASVNHCSVKDGIRSCESPAPQADASGGGSSNRTDYIACGTAGYYTVSVGSGASQVIAGASASCSKCPQ